MRMNPGYWRTKEYIVVYVSDREAMEANKSVLILLEERVNKLIADEGLEPRGGIAITQDAGVAQAMVRKEYVRKVYA